jgi:2-polyprenyl-3-methyl-5-hydroxy-6-metoxy-1,4-benzoquinol methylase
MTHPHDDDNLLLAESQDAVDAINSQFYGRIQYPWPPGTFERVQEPTFWAQMLAQDVGSWDRPVLPPGARVWVAGCGTNQALITALKFPQAAVIGSDLSRESLDVCAGNARQVGAANLELRNESINKTAYREEFDYVICTGVIHHNANPAASLARLAAALKPTGVLELMVYNRYHRTQTTAFQKAVRTLLGKPPGAPNLDEETRLARKIIDGLRADNLMSAYLQTCKEIPPAQFADRLLQPVEHSYTVESLAAMAAACGLELAVPCVDQFSRAAGTVYWFLEVADPELQRLLDTLPDARRWQVTNLLLAEKSPMLWFYLRRQDPARPRRTVAEVCEAFLNTRFLPSKTKRTIYLRKPDGRYEAVGSGHDFPGAPKEPLARKVYEALNGNAPLRETVKRLGLDTGFRTANRLRIHLATSAFPYLTSRDL